MLDIGCGDGALLAYLARPKGVDGRGIELSQFGVNSCVGHGCPSFKATPTTDLEAYPDEGCDGRAGPDPAGDAPAARGCRGVRVHRPAGDRVLSEFRVLAHPIRAFADRPHAGFDCLAHPWYETPNIHLHDRDFVALCDEIGVRVDRSATLDRHGQPYSLDPRGSLAICSPSKASSSFAGGASR